MTPGYRALREGAALLDLGHRGHIRAIGDDRARLLHAMTTNHVEQLQPGQIVYAFFLTAQGRILGDVNLLCLDDALLLDTEPESAQRLYEHLDKFIIADDVTLEDRTPDFVAVAVEGPRAAEMPGVKIAPNTWLEWNGALAAGLSATGAPGIRLLMPAAEAPAVRDRLVAAGAVEATDSDRETVRLENGKARYGVDFDEKIIPQETQLLHAIHFSKGCYLGQEIVERVRARGLVHRLLTPLVVDASEPPPPETPILLGDQNVGRITSSAWSPSARKVSALGYVRDIALAGNQELRVGGFAARPTGKNPV